MPFYFLISTPLALALALVTPFVDFRFFFGSKDTRIILSASFIIFFWDWELCVVVVYCQNFEN